MAYRLALDDAGNVVPVMGLRPAGGVQLAFTDTSARTAQLAAGDRVGAFVSVLASEDCFLEAGGDTVEASTSTSHFLAAGERRDFYLAEGSRYLAAIRASADGTLYVSLLDGAA